MKCEQSISYRLRHQNIYLFLCSFLIAWQLLTARPPQNSNPYSYTDKWTFVVYLAGNNNLSTFASWNIKQMTKIGSTPTLNILVQLDQTGSPNTTRYLIQQNQTHLVESFPTTQYNASGSVQSLYDCIRWATTYPADHLAVIIWNHGSGPLDPQLWGRESLFRGHSIFRYNQATGLLELDRTFPLRGIAFNDAFHLYLTNDQFHQTLQKSCTNLLGGKKISLLGMDACYMASTEIACQLKDCAEYMVASEEIEPGPGWNYSLVLQPFLNGSLTPREFAKHIVMAYQKEYKHSFADYTQSAFDLTCMDQLEHNVDTVARGLIDLLALPQRDSFFNTLNLIRSSSDYTTAFFNRHYIDLQHLYESLLQFITPSMGRGSQERNIIQTLHQQLIHGINIIQNLCVANACGPKAGKAGGLSIYFPTRMSHDSYPKSYFARVTHWKNFLDKFLAHKGDFSTELDSLQDHATLDDIENYLPTQDAAGNIIRRNKVFRYVSRKRSH